MSDWRLYEIHLNGEMPQIGSGRRLVEAQVGRKWAYVRAHTRATRKRRHRLSVKAWEALGAQPREEHSDA